MSDTVILRKVYALNSNTGLFLSTNQSLFTDGKGGTTWMPIISSLTVAGGSVIGDLPSTISTISTQLWSSFGEISSLYSTTNALSTAIYNVTPGNVDPVDLISTVDGLGDSGYISSTQLASTVTHLSFETVSTVSSLGTLGYVSTSWLDSTITGLGDLSYISSLSLGSSITSSVNSLGTVGYVSSASLTSTVTGLGNVGYISSTQLASTLNNLGNYIAANNGYISTASLQSTTTFLLSRPVSFNTVDNATINSASTVNITTATNVYYGSSFYLGMSSFYNSSISVTGSVQSNINAYVSSSSNIWFSTAIFNLSNTSPLLGSNSRVTIEFQPTFIFSAPFQSGTSYPLNVTLTTQLAFGATSNLMTTSTANLLYSHLTYSYLSTVFQPYIKFTLPSNVVQNMLSNSNTFMMHQITGGFAGGGNTSGFALSNFSVFCPTSSIFLSIQNTLT